MIDLPAAIRRLPHRCAYFAQLFLRFSQQFHGFFLRALLASLTRITLQNIVFLNSFFLYQISSLRRYNFLAMPKQLAVETLAISAWVKNLAAIPERDFTLENVQDTYSPCRPPRNAGQVLFFSKGNYMRNLIFKNDLFECMTICWEIGQNSAFTIIGIKIAGCPRRSALKNPEFPRRRKRCQLRNLQNCSHRNLRNGRPHPVHVNPLEPVHQVLNSPDFNQRAVCIHVYSKPFDSCEVYAREQGTYGDVPFTTPASTASSTPRKSSSDLLF